MGGRRDLQGRFQSSKPRVSKTTTIKSATAKPPTNQNTVPTLVDPDVVEAAQTAHAPHDLPITTVEDAFKLIVLATVTTTTSQSNDRGVKTRGMKKRSLTPINNDQEAMRLDLATTSNNKHNLSTPHPNATRKRALAPMNEDYGIARPDSATPSHKKQKTSPTDSSRSRDSMTSSIETPDTKISRETTTSPGETSKSNTSIRQKTKSSSKSKRRTKSEVQRIEAMDRARRAETRAEKAEQLLMLADNENPARLRLDVLRFFKEEIARKSDQIEVLSRQVEERELEIAQQKGRIRSHIDWEKTYKADLMRIKEELKTERALVMEYLKLIIQRNEKVSEQDKTILKLQGELDGFRTTVTQKDEKIRKIQGDQKSVKGAIESIWGS
ncbi:hypothetical protein JMJ35_000155 [Cladonia borealis]|uniref:Uncharacterized protein n=1 Tax=Cladonia borealis TaxID=184061 RepID=A0AA39R8V2_9LECA|nr:hypothetical protein JMJ35_000155 [Cladonia borealis]